MTSIMPGSVETERLLSSDDEPRVTFRTPVGFNPAWVSGLRGFQYHLSNLKNVNTVSFLLLRNLTLIFFFIILLSYI